MAHGRDTVVLIAKSDPLAHAATVAIHAGDVPALTQLLKANPDLAIARIGPGPGSCHRDQQMSRTLLHVATDWPGNFPNGPATVAALIAAGADVNARFTGPHTETPLHWAASSDDVAVLDTLLDHGADIEATGGVIGNGTPLADAVAFGQWRAARRLIERGAVANLCEAAALGLMERVARILSDEPMPRRKDITTAFWCAAHGGQRAASEFLLHRGADINWIGFDMLTAVDVAQRSGATDLVAWLRENGGKSAAEMVPPPGRATENRRP
jgi:ankyrin repeat protein